VEWTRAFVGLPLLCLGSCSSAEDVPASATDEELTFEVFHASIDGLERRRGRDRFAALAPALAASKVDVVCLQGVADPGDRASLKVALARVYPFSVDLPTDDGSVVDDIRDVTGSTPPAPTHAPCADVASMLNQVEECLSRNGCTAERGGVITGRGNCVTDSFCIPVAMLDADPERRCTGCVQAHLRGGARVAVANDRCTRLDHPLALDGQHGMAIFSKLPLSRPSLVVLPAEGARRAILGATITTPRGSEIDVVCARLGPTVASGLPDDPPADQPYPGVYGSPADGWLRENELHIERLATHVAARRENRPAVVMGNFGTNTQVTRSGVVVVPAAGPIGAQRLAELFASGVAADYSPSCTVCRENALFEGEIAESFQNRILLAGLDASAVRATTRTHLGNIIAPGATDELYGIHLPISVQYGLRSRITIPHR
jgi:hypothetical protein